MAAFSFACGGNETPSGLPLHSDAPLPQEPDPVEPVFSLSGGLLEKDSLLELSLPGNAPAGSCILYSLDGSIPDLKSVRYEKSIQLLRKNDCTVVRAAIFDADGKILGPVVTNTYIKKGASSLRTVSLTVDPDDLYNGKTGILANRSGTGREWERPCSVEIIEPDGNVIIRQDAAVRLSGAGSRPFNPASFRIVARKSESLDPEGIKYNGGGTFKGTLFDGCGLELYDKFLLRNGGNDALTQARSDFLRQTGCRDAIANNVCAALEEKGWVLFAQREEPVSVYLNGEFYAVLNMKQDFDEDFTGRLCGLESKSVDILKGKKNGKEMWYKIENGKESCLDDWQNLCAYAIAHALSDDYDEAYKYVSGKIDIESAVSYFTVMTYLCNTDWPQNNVVVWRYGSEETRSDSVFSDGKWRFVIRDMDLCFALHDEKSRTSSTTYSMADTDTFERLLIFYRDGNGYSYDESTGLYADVMGIQGLFDFLLRSEEFRACFKEAASYLMSDSFADICRSETERYFALVQPEIDRHIKRWQSAGSLSMLYTFSDWLKGKEDILTFVTERPEYYQKYMEKAFSYYE